MPEYKIVTTQGEFEFTGEYRRDLETNNWHYYEKDDGTIIHFRKEHMVAVIGDTAESIKANKLPLLKTKKLKFEPVEDQDGFIQ